MSTRAIFWNNDINYENNFIVGVLTDGYPVLPNDHYNGMNLRECRNVPSLTNFINRWEKEYIEGLNEKLNKAKESGNEFDIQFYSQLLSSKIVTWSLDEFEQLVNIHDFNYVLKKKTVYISDPWGGSEYPMDEFFIEKLAEDRKNFFIAACDNCVVKGTCSRSIEQKTLCDAAYNEVKEYVNKLLNE